MKKFLAISMAAILTAGSVFSLVACGEEKNPDGPDTPNQGQPNTPDTPDTPNTGKTIKDELLDKLAEFELGQFSFEGAVTGKTQFFSYDQESKSVVEELSEIKVNASGAVKGDDLDFIATGTADDENVIGIAFLRGENFYVTSPDFWGYWEGSEINDEAIDAYLNQFKDGDRYFYTMEMEEMAEMDEVEALAQNPIVPYIGRILMNVCFFGEGKLETTENGYSLTCDPLESAAALATSVSNVLSVVSSEMELSILVSAAPVVEMIDKLFAGISAEELYALYKKNVDKDAPIELPAPDSDSVSGYLAKIVDSEELYFSLIQALGENPFPGAMSFGDITLKQIIDSDEDFDGMLGQIQGVLGGLKDKENLLDNLIHMIPGSEELSSFDANIEYVFDFDKNKDLTRITMNGDLSMSGDHAVETPDGEVNKVEVIEVTLEFVITVEDVTLRDLTGMHYDMGVSPILEECEGSFHGYVDYYELIDGEPTYGYGYWDAEASYKVEANNVIVVTVCIAEIEYEETFTLELKVKETGSMYDQTAKAEDVFDTTLEAEGESLEVRVYVKIEIFYIYDASGVFTNSCQIYVGGNRVSLDFSQAIGTI